MRQKVLSTRAYRGYTIDHIQDEVYRSGVPFHGNYYQKITFWWSEDFQWDEPTWNKMKEYINNKIGMQHAA